MARPIVTVRVVPTCDHSHIGDGKFTGSGEAYEGRLLTVSSQGVWVDNVLVIQRDRSNQEPGHDWLCEGAPYTGFYVSVETRKEVTP